MNRLALAMMVALVAAGLAYQMFVRVDRPYHGERFPRHEAILEGTAEEPYRFRVLVPAMTGLIARTLTPAIGQKPAFLAAYLGYDFVAIFASLAGIVLLLSGLGFGAGAALAGSLLFAVSLSVTMQDQWFQPWSLLEPGLLALGILVALRGQWTWLALIVALACLNRETGILVGLAGLLAAPRERRVWGAFLLGIGILAALRMLIGPGPPEIDLAHRLSLNLDPGHLRLAAQGAILAAGPAALLALPGVRLSPPPLRRIALLVPLHLLLILAFGVWRESRLLLVILPVLIAISWHALFPQERRPAGAQMKPETLDEPAPPAGTAVTPSPSAGSPAPG